MASLNLFDDFAREDPSPASCGEDSFSFLNRADGLAWDRIRHVLEAWFADYPSEHAADLRGRFRSKLPGAHQSAWWELYLHRLFTRLGYGARVHPEVPGTTRQPDFELRRGDERIYVEAAVVFSGVVEEGRDGAKEAWIMDAVDKGRSQNFHVGIQFEQLGTHRPRDRDIYKPLEAWLATLDPDAVATESRRTGEVPEWFLRVDDWVIRFDAYPVDPEFRDKPAGRLLGVGPVSGGTVDDKQQLRDTLKHKRGRYGKPDVPLVVAVNCASSFMKEDDVSAALYGSVAVQYRLNEAGPTKWVRVPDGTWTSESGPRGQRMSAVLVAVQLHPGTAASAAPAVWLNPWAHIPLEPDWPFSVWRCSNTGLVTRENRTVEPAALLGLPPGWPGPEPVFGEAQG